MAVTVTDFTGVNGSPWPSPFVDGSMTSGADATIDSNQGLLDTGTVTGYVARVSQRYDTSLSDYAVRGKVLFNSSEMFLSVAIRSLNNLIDTKEGYYLAVNKGNWNLTSRNNYSTLATLTSGTFTYTSGVPVNFVLQAFSDIVAVKVWPDDVAEPEWAWQGTDSTSSSGYAGITMSGGAAAHGTARLLQWDFYDTPYDGEAPPTDNTFSVTYDCVSASSKSVTGDAVGSDITQLGLVKFEFNPTDAQTYSTSPVLQVVGNVGSMSTSKYFEFTITPPSSDWNPTTLSFKAARGGSSTPRGYVVRTSKDGYTANIDSLDITTVRPTWTSRSIDLSSLGQLNGSLTFRFYPYSPSTSNTLEFDDLSVSGTPVDTVTEVSKTQDLSWNVKAVVTKSLITAWNIKKTISTSRIFSWNISTDILVQKSVEFIWNIKQRITKTQAASWDIFSTVSVNKNTTWNVLTSLQRQLETKWNITGPLILVKSFTWNIYTTLTKQQSSTWNILLPVQNTISFAWSIVGQIERLITFSWLVKRLWHTVEDGSGDWNPPTAEVEDIWENVPVEPQDNWTVR